MKTLPSRIAIDHPLTHHGGNPDSIEKVTRINTCHAAQVAAFLDKLKGAGEADGTLLDRMGVRPESIGDSTAPHEHILDVQRARKRGLAARPPRGRPWKGR